MLDTQRLVVTCTQSLVSSSSGGSTTTAAVNVLGSSWILSLLLLSLPVQQSSSLFSTKGSSRASFESDGRSAKSLKYGCFLQATARWQWRFDQGDGGRLVQQVHLSDKVPYILCHKLALSPSFMFLRHRRLRTNHFKSVISCFITRRFQLIKKKIEKKIPFHFTVKFHPHPASIMQ